MLDASPLEFYLRGVGLDNWIGQCVGRMDAWDGRMDGVGQFDGPLGKNHGWGWRRGSANRDVGFDNCIGQCVGRTDESEGRMDGVGQLDPPMRWKEG